MRKVIRRQKNQKRITLALIVLSFFQNSQSEPVYIAVASNLEKVFVALEQDFKKQENTELVASFNATGVLASQIQLGAPYSLFLAADDVYPEKIFIQNTSQYPYPPQIYAKGHLALLCSKAFINQQKTLKRSFPSVIQDKQDLTKILNLAAPGKIAIANPKTAPYGRISLKMLDSVNFQDSKETNSIVHASNVSGVNHYIETQVANCGFVALSSVIEESDHAQPSKNTAVFYFSKTMQEQYSIQQSLLLLKQNEQAEAFYHYLLSDRAQAILQKYGYHKP